MSLACPSPGEILRSLLQPLAPADRADLTAHIAACAACRARFDVYRTLSAGRPEIAGAPPAAATPACPDPTALATITAGTGGDGRVLDHVAGCEACLRSLAGEIQTTHRARRQAHATPEPIQNRRARGVGPIARPAFALAALVLAVTLFLRCA